MDLIGASMGLATVFMAALTLGGLAGGILLAFQGAWQIVALGIAAFCLCALFAQFVELIVIAIDDLAARALLRSKRLVANLIAVISGLLPLILIIVWEYSFFELLVGGSGRRVIISWLWSYVVATAPWTILATRVSRFRRTLCGIRAYAGHLAYWLLSISVLIFDAPPSVGLAIMLIPAILPFVVGYLLALADRDALTNVRV